MTISIYDHELPDETHNIYDVTFYGDQIRTLVTRSPPMVDAWIQETEHIHRIRLNQLVVGLDVEWRPNFGRNIDNPVATIQLCVGRRCLIFQPIHAPSIPQSLRNFMNNGDYTFVGVGIVEDIEKLLYDYSLSVSRAVDLRYLAAGSLNRRELNNAGIKILAREILAKEVNKPKRVTLSRWDNPWLTPDQVQYACVDALLSFEIGRSLQAWNA